MKPENPQDSSPPKENEQDGQTVPADALSRTPDDLQEEQAAHQAEAHESVELLEKKISPFKRFLRKINVYFLGFLLVLSVVGASMAINYFNTTSDAPEAAINSQELNQDTLEQLSNTNASVGASSQTLTVQGNAIIQGETLMRGRLNVAGNFQTAGSIQGSNITIAGKANLGDIQTNTLQVAQNVAIEGSTTVRELSVGGNATFSGTLTASQLTVSKLILSGNSIVEIPNHLTFSGPTPSRSINPAALGSGGSASVNGSDSSGTVNISTGNNPSAGCFVKVSFRSPFSGQPRVIVSPVGKAAGLTDHYVDRDGGGFSICSASPAPARQSFAFDYFVAN